MTRISLTPSSSATFFLRPRRLCWALALLGLCSPVAALACDTPVGELSSAEGHVEVRGVNASTWQPARPSQVLCAGDTLTVRAPGRAAVTLHNQVMVRLDQNSTLTLHEVGTDANVDGHLDLSQGIAHIISRWRKRLSVVTPFINALVDGTEFTVLSTDTLARVTVAEGRVRVRQVKTPTATSTGSPPETVLLADQAAEIAAGPPQDAAPPAIAVRPLDAVAWAIHYPQIVWLDATQLATLPPETATVVQHAQQLSAHGQYRAALAALQGLPNTSPHPPAVTAMLAAVHLALGQADAAQQVLDHAPSADVTRAYPDVLAVRALLRTTRNDSAEALRLAQQAVQAAPTTAAAALAQSYALQGARQLPQALQAARRATAIAPDNPLAWSRRSELELAAADLHAGQASAEQALQRQPNAHRALALKGLAQLLAGQTQASLITLNQAITANSSDPLARFARGMAQIRQGGMAEGRQDVELAALLDPSNAELRAYLGRAYLDERRDKVARDQFELAKRLDTASPTPWFFDAVQRLHQADGIGALHASTEAAQRNAGRTTVRPSDLTLSDLASRSLQVADAHTLLGNTLLAQSAAERAYLEDPLDAQTLAGLGRTLPAIEAESARTSAWTQAILRQPIGSWPVPPQFLTPSLPGLDGPRLLALDESAQLFTRSGRKAAATTTLGSRGIRGASALGAWNNEQWQLDLSGFDYRSDPDLDGERADLNGLRLHTQFAPQPGAQLHLEVLHTDRVAGTVYTPLLPDGGNALFRDRYTTDRVLVGSHLAVTPHTTWTTLLSHNESGFDSHAPQQPENGFTYFGGRRNITATHLDHLSQGVHYQFGVDHKSSLTRMNILTPLPDQSNSVTALGDSVRRGHKVYAQASGTLPWVADLRGQIGLRHVNEHSTNSQNNALESVAKLKETQPAFGLDWGDAAQWRVRAAWFKTVGQNDSTEVRLEPVTFNGFVRDPDDVVGSPGIRRGVALDLAHSSRTPTMLEITQHRYHFNDYACAGDPDLCQAPWQTTQVKIASTWLATDALAAGVEVTSKDTRRTTAPTHRGTYLATALDTDTAKLTTSWRVNPAWRLLADAQHVTQEGQTFLSPIPQSTSFWITNVKAQNRLNRQLSLSAEVKNLFNREFRYEDSVFPQPPGVTNHAPRRTVAVSAQWQWE